jgi:type III restriction enzyme
MPTALTLKFDPNQEHQSQAISAAVDLFEGLSPNVAQFQLGGEIIPNLPPSSALERTWLLENLLKVQERNGIPLTAGLEEHREMVLEGAGYESWNWPSFTIEMETGTGKTYAYLRTINELRQRYGFGKFVVVVPSVAIYEGVVKSFEITRSHLRSLYENEPVNLIRYEGTALSRLRGFAQSTGCEILVMTLDAFNRASGRGTNVIYRSSEKLPGELKPYQYIQETRPILILDEPQNMGSTLARSALATLHPLFALRYSATHRESPNVVYRLTPFEAFQRNLVKRIQVWGVTEHEDYNRPFLRLDRVSNSGGIRATVTTWVTEHGATREAEIRLKVKDDLQRKTGRPEHRGYIVDEIHVGEKWMRFDNGVRLEQGTILGPDRPAVFKLQIAETIRQHMVLQERLGPKGIKVLSLFFIDRVANYTAPDGMIRKMFDDEFKRLRKEFGRWADKKPEQIREAYFAQRIDRSGELSPVDLELDDEEQNAEQRKLAKVAFELIMRKKEQLLSLSEPVSFIFAHSALKEGWDNPNVFQICTLNQTTSEMKKRQEIGRGLRICVDQSGARIPGDELNVLTVIANQSYASYARQLQSEYREAGEADEEIPMIRNARQRPAIRNDSIFLKNADFDEFWRRLSQRCQYRIHLDVDALVHRSIGRLAYLPRYPEPKLVLEKGHWEVHRYTLTLKDVQGNKARIHLKHEATSGDETASTLGYQVGAVLGEIHHDIRLMPLRIEAISNGSEPSVEFANRIRLSKGVPAVFQSEEGQQVARREIRAADVRYPVFNLMDRTAKETGLTRATLGRIFKGLPQEAKLKIFKNPEGFAATFISEIREILGDMVASGVSFELTEAEPIHLEVLFPKEKRLAEHEQKEAGERGLYDLVQAESGPERRFVDRLKDDKQVVFYFKFPAAFKVSLPRLIGNYNPDWGIVRRDDTGKLTLHLVRETKGTTDKDRLRFPHERRKVVCATKYFGAAGMDYRQIDGETPDWWLPAPTQGELDIQST